MRYRLIALDLDGTLTNDRKEITERTLRCLQDLQESGVRLMIASARPSPGVERESELLGLPEHGGVLMSYNGGRITLAGRKEVLCETSIPLSVTRRVLRELEKYPVTVIMDDGEMFYVTDPRGYKVEYECRNNRMACRRLDNLAEQIAFEPVKFLMSVQPEMICQVQREIASWLPRELRVVQTAPFYLEIIPASVNKGEGLRKVCSFLDIPLGQTAAFGDSENDIAMLRAAGAGVAMGNASPEVRSAADFVTGTNNEDGIAEWLSGQLLFEKRVSW